MITETECTHYLAKLDRLHIIDLLSQFLKSGFNRPGSLRVFIPGLLSERSRDAFTRKLLALGKEYTELHRQDCDLPLGKRRSIGLLLAMREWEFAAFRPFLRHLNK